MRIGDQVFCVGCLQETAVLRTDKHGRPWLYCQACGTRSFLRGRPSLAGYERLYGALALALKDNNVPAAREIVREAPHATATASV